MESKKNIKILLTASLIHNNKTNNLMDGKQFVAGGQKVYGVSLSYVCKCKMQLNINLTIIKKRNKKTGSER